MYKIFLVENDPGIAKGIAQLAESWGLAIQVDSQVGIGTTVCLALTQKRICTD
ncbi:MAG: hypothetical protein SOV91_06010 [Eubacteriales bacterium]|nr:hypothetical protein [Eubacteriales bacterium]